MGVEGHLQALLLSLLVHEVQKARSVLCNISLHREHADALVNRLRLSESEVTRLEGMLNGALSFSFAIAALTTQGDACLAEGHCVFLQLALLRLEVAHHSVRLWPV